KKLEGLNVGSYAAIKEAKKKYADMISKFPRKYSYLFKTVNSFGDNLISAKNCYYCFDISNAQDCKFITWGGINMKDTYDGYGMGVAELLYEVIDSGLQASHMKFTVVAWTGKNIHYSYNCHNCNNIFGCIGLRSKEYCILNKQYSKEEYEKLVPRIIGHMKEMPYVDSKGRRYGYGEFFPAEISPFAYNETVAQEYFQLTKGEALSDGYAWKDPEIKNYSVTRKPEDLPDNIKDASEEITNDIIGCLHRGECLDQCATAFRIIPEELKFYKKMNLPLPRLCPNCRHYRRLRQRNPLKLWHRKCQCGGVKSENGIYSNTAAHQHAVEHCPNEFETSYAPDRPEIVYCEACYNNEVA
ncbi:MAG TPA: hypothetical protein VMV71_01730, partial [Candidatus Paceibacterota bacterium]|nr:hypothetical protein [Candidatus Paceibacterota bacterium]